MTIAGVGASAGVQHTLSGMVYRTFSAPLPQVRQAVLEALKKMDIKVKGRNLIWTGEEILARTTDREIKIELEAVTPKTTRIMVMARSTFLDSATATEIVAQTEKALQAQEERKAAEHTAKP